MMNASLSGMWRSVSRMFAGGRATGMQGNYLCLLAGLMASAAKADGFVDTREVGVIESAFIRLGFSSAQCRLCMSAFHDALARPVGVDFYAARMMESGFGTEMRLLAYELIWEIASADGKIVPAEDSVLHRLERALYLAPGTFARCFARHVRREASRPVETAADELSKAFQELGCPRDATEEQARTAYRELAKKLHPDALRAQGLPEAMMSRATDRMARVNAAWERVRASF